MENQEDVVVVRKEEDIRESVISEYGFDADNDVEKIDKIVAKELEHDKKLSSAIGAKIKHRNEAEELKKKIPPPPVVVPPVEKPESKESVMSPKDYLALTEAKVTSEDFDEVVRVSKILGKPITEALKDKTLISILETRAEERKTASATQTKGGARGSSKVTGEDLIAQAREGKLPETDAEWDKLAIARIEAKRTKK